ncbi:MAG TPA: TonB-dependent receptor, partial [Pyrinomonadaceae bacterium]
KQSLLTVGANLHFNQINVGLYPSINRNPNRKFLPENIDNPNVLYTKADAKVNNYAAYIQNGIDFFNGHLRIETGLRFDYFTFDVNGFELGGKEISPQRHKGTEILNKPLFSLCLCVSVVNPLIVKESAGKFQPKFAVVWSPFEKTPVSFYANYGRGISSQDARGVVRNREAPKISVTDFYQSGASYNSRRASLVFSSFLIDRSNEQVYIPDDGSIEFAGRSRSYGFEIRNSIRFTRWLSFNAGLTQVIKAFYPGEFTADNRRVVVDSAPKTVANGSFVLSELRGFNASLNWRHISSYRLDGEDARLKASGHDVVDFSLSKRLKKWVDLNFSIDNLFNKRYYETQNYFESRLLTDTPVGLDPDTGRNIYPSRIHATPGYPFTVNIGLTFRFGAKD